MTRTTTVSRVQIRLLFHDLGFTTFSFIIHYKRAAISRRPSTKMSGITYGQPVSPGEGVLPTEVPPISLIPYPFVYHFDRAQQVSLK